VPFSSRAHGVPAIYHLQLPNLFEAIPGHRFENPSICSHSDPPRMRKLARGAALSIKIYGISCRRPIAWPQSKLSDNLYEVVIKSGRVCNELHNESVHRGYEQPVHFCVVGAGPDPEMAICQLFPCIRPKISAMTFPQRRGRVLQRYSQQPLQQCHRQVL